MKMFNPLLLMWLGWSAADTPVAPQEADQWLRWVIPMPKQVVIGAKRVVPVQKVAIRLLPSAGELERRAAEELSTIGPFKAQEASPTGRQAADFELLLGCCDEAGRLAGQPVPGAEALARLPNKDQAYVIAPAGANALALVGLDPRGVYYAAQTFGQLLRPMVAEGRVAIPLARLTDWPDMAERGLWWFNAAFDDRELDWFSGLKLNHLEILAQLRVAKDKPATATIDAQAVARCRARAIKMMPAVVHLEQLQGTGLFEVYPETSGRGDPEAWKKVGGVHPICFSQPNTQRVFDEWFTALARTVDSDDLMVWFSENAVYCACDQCRQIEQFQHEMKVVLHAWAEARKVRPTLRLRLLLTQGSFPQNMALIRAAPPEVGITYYHGADTYTVRRRPMIYPELRQAMKGRWFGCYPTLCGAYWAPAPFAAAAYMKERMTELQQAGVQSVAGFAVPLFRLHELALSAAAEFAWNSTGRSPRQFMLAWATRQRLPEPEKVADWWALVEEAQRSLYISMVVERRFWDRIQPLLDQRVAVQPGSHFLAGFPQAGDLETYIAAVERSRTLAQTIPHQQFVHASTYALGLLRAVEAARDLTARLAARPTLTDMDKKDLAALCERMYDGFDQAAEAVSAWDRTLVLYPGQKVAEQTTGTVDCLRTAQGRLAEYARRLGLEAPFIWYTRQRIGSWQTGTFPPDGRKVEHRLDVTDLVRGPGTYGVTFDYTAGTEALEMERVVLVAKTADGREHEVAADVHRGRTGAWDEKNDYRLVLRSHDPQARYVLVASVGVTASQRDPKNRTSQGDILFRRLRE